MQKIISVFKGYQVCLDLGICACQYFNSQQCTDVGPGAYETLSLIFNALPHQEGMVPKRGDQLVAIPFAHELGQMMATHEVAQDLRMACTRYNLPVPDGNTGGFLSCEDRQWIDKLQQKVGLGRVPTATIYPFYVETLRSPMYCKPNGFFVGGFPEFEESEAAVVS